MIASQKIGRNFTGALTYNLKKLNHPEQLLRAELLATNFASLDLRVIQNELDMVRSLRPNLNRYVYHTSLNFSKEDVISNEKMLEIANEYLHRNGFKNNQYFIFRHHDAEHPHIHLLVNRITFDGDVVSDSNNFKKSEAILRLMENKYGLESVTPSANVADRAVTKDELEMIARTGKVSEKMLLQELMRTLLADNINSVTELIKRAEKVGVYFLCNQASTGRVTGITYFHNGFKVKGQALGNQFKWAQIAKKFNYEQIRDSKAISEANERTKAKFGRQNTNSINSTANGERRSGIGVVPVQTSNNLSKHGNSEQANNDYNTNNSGFEQQSGFNEKESDSQQTNDVRDFNITDYDFSSSSDLNIQINDDVDDEAIHGRNRHLQKKARTNRR